jgi:hypothetical protein
MSGFEKLAASFPKNSMIGNQAHDNYDYHSGIQHSLNKQLMATKQRYRVENAHAPPAFKIKTTAPPTYGYSDEIETMLAQKKEIESKLAEIDRVLADKERKKIQAGGGRADRPFSMMPNSSRTTRR